MNIRGRLFYLCTLAVFLAVLISFTARTPKVDAQGSRVAAALEGTVKDSTGGVISGAAVAVLNTATNQARNLETNDMGFFHVEALPVGAYGVRVEHAGFAAYRQKEIDLTLGQTSHLDVVLSPAGLSEEVSVNAQQQAFEVSQASVVSPVDRERIEELPVQSRNSLDFVLLSPGVLSAPPAPPVPGGSPLAGSGFTFGGLRTRSNTISIDGLENDDEYTGSGRTELSPEIVQEFQVVQNGLSAESGGAAGGSINVITRSGSNAIHGDAFIFAQDAALSARDPFESEQAKPSFRRFREGVSLGGPVVKDRTFYYAAVEQEHNRGENGSEIDPAVAATINNFLAAGAFPGLATRRITTNFFPISRAETEAAGKLDHQLTKSTALMLRYAFTNNREAGDAYNTSGLTDVSARGSSFIADNSLSGSLTTAYGSDSIGDLRFQAATRHAVLRPTQSNGPEIDIAGVVDFGRPYDGVSDRRENHYQASYSFTGTRGKNTWKAGAAIHRVSLRAAAPDGFGGIYFFNTLQDFLSARPAQFRQAFGDSTAAFAVTNFSGFVQDHYSLTSSLSADFGVRYDFEKLPSQFNEATHNFSPRIGLAWSTSSRWVVRAGYGIFFDRYVLADLAQSVNINGSQGLVQVADGNAATNLFLASHGGPLPAPAPGIAPSIFRPDSRMGTPYSQQASSGVEHQVSKFISVRADFLFVRGVDLPRTLNINLLPPVILTPANAASLGVPNPTPQQIGRPVFSPARVDTSLNDIYELSNSATSTYKGVSFTLNRRMNDELAFAASYTLSRTLDDASDFNEQPQNPFQLTQENARSLQNQTHRFVFNALWELPIGDEDDQPADQRSDQPDNVGWLTRTFRHIEVAPIFTAESGHPADPVTGLDSNQTHAFPFSSRPFNFGRNSLQTSSTVNMDFRVLKYFPFGATKHLDVVGEFFNLFNHPNVLEINPVFGSGVAPIAGFDAPLEGLGARQAQFSLDFEFK